jgi:hypothetical protein
VSEQSSEHLLKKIHNYYYQEIREKDERPFDWYADWEWVDICLYNVEVSDGLSFYEHEFSWDLETKDLTKSEQPGLKPKLSEKEKSEYVVLINEEPKLEDFYTFGIHRSEFETDEEYDRAVKEYQQTQLEETREARELAANVYNYRFKNTAPKFQHIGAKFGIEDIRSIGLIREGEKAPRLGQFDTGSIFLRQSDEPMGTMWLDGEKDDDTGEDERVLRLQFCLPSAQFAKLVVRLQNARPGDKCIIRFYFLAFRSEMDRFLSEPHYDQTFFIEDTDRFRNAILGSISVISKSEDLARPAQGYAYEEEAFADEEQEEFFAAAPKRRIPSNPKNELRPLLISMTVALWLLVFLLMIR